MRWGDTPGDELADARPFWGRTCAVDAVRWAIDRSHARGATAQLWAHYGGGFDARFVLPALCAPVEDGGAESAQVLDVGSTVLRFWGRMADGARFDLRDSIRLLPGSLARIGEELGTPKLDATFKHRTYRDGRRCHCTRCLVRTREGRAELLRYCARDTLILWRGLSWAESELAELGVSPMRLTLAGNAAASVLAGLSKDERPYTPHGEELAPDPWEAMLDGHSSAHEPAEDVPERAPDVDRDAEEGAAGGRTEKFLDGLRRGELWDRRASYPAAMAEGPLPWRYAGPGDPREWPNGVAKNERALVWAEVHVPEEIDFPVLPWRDPKGKLLFPVGRWRGCFYDEELAYAQETCSVNVRSIWRVERWHTGARLSEWALALWERIKHAKGFARYFAKILRNAAYGKFLQAREQRSYTLRPIDEEGYSRVHDRLPLWFRDFTRQPACRNVATACGILARARIALHKAIVATDAAGGRVAYCDTDSVLCSGRFPRELIGPELGQWDRQAKVADATILAPKLYRYRDREDDSEVVKAKGIRRMTWADFDRLAKGEAMKTERGRGWKESIRAGSVDYDRVRVERRWLMGARPKRAPDGKGGSRPWIVDGTDYAEPWEG